MNYSKPYSIQVALIGLFLVLGVLSYVRAAPVQLSPNPQTFLLNGDQLVANKQKVKRKDKVLTKALADLVQTADQALQRGPYSVTSKSKVPPSGDKRDYMSVGPYWWPDSSKADGLPYIRKDGQVNPERHAIKDSEYFNALCREVHLLGVAWYFTEDRRYADHAAKLLRVWFLDEATRMNPHLNYGQAIPGHTEGRGIGLIDTRNLAKLIDGVQLLKGSTSLSAQEYNGIRDWYRQYLNWMLTSPIGQDEADEHNNHGTWYDVQAVSIALFTEQPELARKLLENQTKARLESQLKPDGSQPHELARTLSWNYSQMNLKGFFELAMLAEKVNVDLWNYEAGGKGIRKAFLYMLPYAEESKQWEHKQIKPRDTHNFLELARMAELKYPGIDLKSLRKQLQAPDNSVLLLTNWTF
ncbi:alginate lyase family protein [Telluribacter sp. SYSU D00476]|uniref:alginate lyase family protein n=1 Tax=Telluribacter sp. SYSU D00476 TaxID=2811430 RepID=UPI001FF68350|nr:alginate lyase family protein [Telluribacter sp. SYSU D00476]